MSELTPEAVALLEAARLNHGPAEGDRRRVLATLHASLGIGVPIALAPAAAEALGGGQGAAQATSSALHGASASLQGAGSSASATLGAGVSAASKVAAPGGAKGALSLAGKLLTWKAGKLLLASVALSSAVGIGVSVAPRGAQDALPRRVAERGHATALASARTDAGASSSPLRAPTPAPTREPTAVTAAPSDMQPAPAIDAPMVAPPATLASPSDSAPEPLRVARASVRPHNKHGSARTHRRASTLRSHAQASHAQASHAQASHGSDHVATAARSALPAPLSADEPVAQSPAEQPLAAPAQASAPLEVEAPSELALIRKAMTSLRDRDAQRALGLLEEHAARFPNGSFATERRGLHVVALCAAGRLDDGRREQAAFLRSAASGSPIAARVRGACSERGD